MSGGVATIGGRKYAVGLYWQPSPSKSVAKAAQEAAKAPGQKADYFSIRAANKMGRLAQFGLGQKDLGHQAGMPAAASSLADQLPGSWTGAFKVEEGYWVVTLRDDLIDPEGDALFADEASAMARIDQEMSRGGLQRIYAPSSWAIPGADDTGLLMLLGGRQSGKLKLATIPKTYFVYAGALVAFVIVLFIAYTLYENHVEQLRLQAEAEQRAQEEARAKAAKAEKERLEKLANAAKPDAGQVQWPPYERQWQKMPLPEVWLSACQNAIMKVPATLAGWKITNVQCSDNTLLVNWARESGPAINLVGLTLDPSTRSATMSLPLEKMEPRGPQSLWKPDDFNTFMLERNLPLTLSPQADDPPPAPPQGAPKDAKPPPPWFKKVGLNFAVKGTPWYWANMARMTPGLILTKLSWAGSNWTLEGVVYEKVSDKED